MWSTLSELLAHFTWSSALDIFLVALVFYGLFYFVQGTRAVTLLRGIVIVVLERGNGSGTARTRAQYVGGILAGVLSALCQATGLALAKRGLGGGFSALSGVTMRMLTAMLALWIAALLTGAARSTLMRWISRFGASTCRTTAA